MGINKVLERIDGAFNRVNIKCNKYISLKNTKSVVNSSLDFKIGINKETKSNLVISNYIANCENTIGETRDSYPVVSFINNERVKLNNVNNKESESNKSIFDTKKENTQTELNLKSKNNINKLPEWITNSGLEKLNTNEEIYFKKIKVRNLKNQIKKITSFMNFLNRVLLPVNTHYVNFKLTENLNGIDFGNKLNDNKSFDEFSDGLKQINNTFIKNVNQVRSKKDDCNNDADGSIKYYTLEKALECKLVKDINKLENELKMNLAKDKFEKNYSSLPSKIKQKLDFILDENMSGDMDKLFSYEAINDLKSFLKENIMDEHKTNKFDNIIMKVFDSVMGDEGKEKILKEKDEGATYIKKELAFNITKNLFNYLSKDNHFIGEEESFNKINKYISDKSESISKSISESFIGSSNKAIKTLKNSFFNNIKSNDDGDDLLIRLFRNSSNNINYKWAQDAVVLLINYETFSNQDLNIKKYNSNGVAAFGGSGSDLYKLSSLQLDLQSIFNRLGLDANDLEKSKDEVMRKYFANYFEHI